MARLPPGVFRRCAVPAGAAFGTSRSPRHCLPRSRRGAAWLLRRVSRFSARRALTSRATRCRQQDHDIQLVLYLLTRCCGSISAQIVRGNNVPVDQ